MKNIIQRKDYHPALIETLKLQFYSIRGILMKRHRPRSGYPTMIGDTLGQSLRFVLIAGQRHDNLAAKNPARRLPGPCWLTGL